MVIYTLQKYDKEAREALASGADQLARAVVSTLGPRSRNVAINQLYPAPKVIHDGVKVAQSIRLKDPFEDMGAVLLREAASKTNDLAGDGTTTATLLANTLVQQGKRLVDSGIVDGEIVGKVNAMELRERLIVASKDIDELLVKQAKKMGPTEYVQVANISAGIPEIGDLVCKAIEKVGQDGVIMVEDGASFESTLDFQEGMEFDNGYLSHFFVTNPDKNTCEYSDAYVLLTDMKIADAELLVPVIEKVSKLGKPLVIIADDVIGPALQALVLTKLKARLPVVAVMAPEFADRRREMLEDIAVMTGATVWAAGLGKSLREVEVKDLGRVKSVIITQTHTTLVPANPDAEEINDRITVLTQQLEAEPNAFRKQKIQNRIGKLSQGVAIIRVGGASDSEIVEKKERAIDAVYALKGALAEGIIPGGGVALRDIAQKWVCRDQIDTLIRDTLRTPYRTILANSGIDEPEEFVAGEGINVITGETVNMVASGIVDPVKVTRLAVQHAFSVAGIMLTTNTLVTEDPEQERQHAKNYFQ